MLGPPGLATRRLAHLLRVKRAELGWSQEEAGRQLGARSVLGKSYSQAHIGKIEALNLKLGAGIDLFEAAIALFALDPDFFFDPGRVELDPAEYALERRRTLAQRIARLERGEDRGKRDELESGTRPTTPTLKRRG